MSKLSQGINISKNEIPIGVEKIFESQDWSEIRVLGDNAGSQSNWRYGYYKLNLRVKVYKDSSDNVYLKNIYIYLVNGGSETGTPDGVRYIRSATDYRSSPTGVPVSVSLENGSAVVATLLSLVTEWSRLDFSTGNTEILLYNISIPSSNVIKLSDGWYNQITVLPPSFKMDYGTATTVSPSTVSHDYIDRNIQDSDLLNINSLGINISLSSPSPSTGTSATCSFYDYQGTLINSGTFTTRDTGNILIDDIANNIGGITVPQTKPDVRKSSGNYYVNYYLASGSSTKVGRGTDTLPGGEMTISYIHKMNGNHYLWSDSLNGSEMVSTTISSGGRYKFYPVFSSISTGDSPPTNFGTNPFPSANRVGYRAENGSRNNNIYYAKNGSQVSPGGGISPDMFSGTNINLYLRWIPVKYVIRFNKGDGEEWINPSNILTTITKTYGESIKYGDIPSLDDQGYPKYEQRLYKNGFKQYGWVNNGSKVYTSGDNSYCTYKYEEDGYKFVREYIGDKWYNDNMTAVDVYPCWYPVNHKVVAHYYTTKGGTEKIDNYDFNIGSPHLSINEPKDLGDKSDTWIFIGWAQSVPPKGDGWEWGSGGTDIRNYGAFRYITDLDNTKYSITYGVNSKSLTKADWDNTSKNLNIYALWSITSRYIYLGSGWKPTTGMWVYINGKWRMIDSLYYQPEDDTGASPTSWKQEIVE